MGVVCTLLKTFPSLKLYHNKLKERREGGRGDKRKNSSFKRKSLFLKKL